MCVVNCGERNLKFSQVYFLSLHEHKIHLRNKYVETRNAVRAYGVTFVYQKCT